MAKKRTLGQLIKDEFEQPSLFNVDSYSDDYSPSFSSDIGSCVPKKAPTHEPKFSSWVQTYWVSRRGTKHQYYRFCYLKTPGEISSCVRVHLPGGNTKSDRANSLKDKVENAITLGKSPQEIIALIQPLK